MSAEGAAFSITRDPLPTYIALAVTLTSVVLSIIGIIIDIASGRLRNRTLLHGVAVKELNTFTRASLNVPGQSTSQPSSPIHDIPQHTVTPTTASATPVEISTSSDHHPNLSIPIPNTNTNTIVSSKPASSRNLPDSTSAQQLNQIQPATPDSTQRNTHMSSSPPFSPLDLTSADPPDAMPRGARRRALCTSLGRLIFVSASLVLLVVSVLLFARFYRDGELSSVAEDNTNQFVRRVMNQALDVYSRDAGRPELHPNVAMYGVGTRYLKPGDVYQPAMWRWVTVAASLCLYCLLGAVLTIARRLVPSPRTVGVVMMIQSIVVLLVAIIASFTHPTKLPLDGTPITRKWLDRYYADADLVKTIGAERLLGNIFIAAPALAQNNTGDETTRNHGPTALGEFLNFTRYFCGSYDASIANQPSDANSPVLPSPSTNPSTPAPSTTESSSGGAAAAPSTQPTPAASTAAPTSAPEAPGSGGVRPTQAPKRQIRQREQPSKSAVGDQGTITVHKSNAVRAPASVAEIAAVAETSGGSRRVLAVNRMDMRSGIQMYEELLMGYVVGKPGGVDALRALSYAALPALTLGPVAAAGMLRTYLLYPLFGAWVATVGVVTVVTVPTALRIVAAPVKPKRLYDFCGRRYRLLISDSDTMQMARIDLAVFILAVFVGIMQAFRWLRMADRRHDEQGEEGVKLVNYEEVYSKNGSLRW